MERPAPELRGVLPPLTTPFDARGDVDLAALARNVERYNATGLRGYVALGTNGEAVHLDAAERRRVVETVRRTAAPGLAVVAGVNEHSTRAAVASVREVAGAGADAVLLITPYFYRSSMTQEALRSFYLEVASSSPLPLLVYNVPQNTGVVIEPAAIAALSGHPAVFGVKDSSGDLAALTETVRLVPAGFQVLVGNAGIFDAALAAGASGAILALACLAPAACVEIHRAALAGDHARARELTERLAPVARMVTSELGVAGLKASLDLAGLAGGPPRSPLRPVADAERRRLEAEMRRSGCFPGLA